MRLTGTERRFATTIVVTCAASLATGAPSDRDGACGRFVDNPRVPGLFAPASTTQRGAAATDGGVAGSACDPIVTGLQEPGAVCRDGNRVYVANTANGDAKLVTVVDVTTPGAEFVVETIATPVNPIDVDVAAGRLFVIDHDRNKLWSRPVSGGAWTVLSLPNGVITEWDYGHILESHGDFIYVIHQWENKIDVVNAVTNAIVTTVTDIDHLPDRIVFVDDASGGTMIALGVGLDAPSCFANGPNFSVYSLTNYQKLYRKSIAGGCPLDVVARDGKVWVAFEDKIRMYDLATGNLLDQLAIPTLGRNAVHNGTYIVAQQSGGQIISVLPNLDSFVPVCDLVANQVWFPPLEQMVAMSASDGRVFVTNRNNNTLDRVQLAPTCPADLDGNGAVDAADIALLLGQWSGAGSADLDGDGSVGAADLAILLGAWGAC
ncbi:MAG: dockerin type I repeat-containing protein [Phycisphaerales bacterium]